MAGFKDFNISLRKKSSSESVNPSESDHLSLFARDNDILSYVNQAGDEFILALTTDTIPASSVTFDTSGMNITGDDVQTAVVNLEESLLVDIYNLDVTLQTQIDDVSGSLDTLRTDVNDISSGTVGITGGITQLDDTYVNVSGDTMTGNLTVPSVSITDNTLSSSKDTGALVIESGGLGVEDDIHIGNSFTATRSLNGPYLAGQFRNTNTGSSANTIVQLVNNDAHSLQFINWSDSALGVIFGVSRTEQSQILTSGMKSLVIGSTSNDIPIAFGSDNNAIATFSGGTMASDGLTVHYTTDSTALVVSGGATFAKDVTIEDTLNVNAINPDGGTLSVTGDIDSTFLYTPDTSSAWSPVPENVKEALDTLRVDVDNISGGTQITSNGTDISTMELSGGIPTSLVPDASGVYDLGSSDRPFRDLYLTNALNAAGASGTDNAGNTLTLAGSRGTGAGQGGSIIFQTAPAGITGSSLNTLETVAQVTETSFDMTKGFVQSGNTTVSGAGGSPDTTATGTVSVYLLDGSTNTCTLALDSNPVDGQRYEIKSINSTNNVTVDRNGNTIDGSASDLILATNESVTLIYDSTFGWAII